jgi:hypothetical protein
VFGRGSSITEERSTVWQEGHNEFKEEQMLAEQAWKAGVIECQTRSHKDLSSYRSVSKQAVRPPKTAGFLF